MPRPPRIFEPDGVYHVISQGSNRQALFLLDAHRIAFLERLADVVERYELACVAYCLMGNHYHLLVQTPDARLSRALQRLNGGYSRAFNAAQNRSAHLFRNRFFSRHIDGDPYLATACRYIVRNPVRAGLCRDPAEWPWSSHRATAGLEPPPRFLSEVLIRAAFGADSAWRERYRDFVDAPGTGEERTPELDTHAIELSSAS